MQNKEISNKSLSVIDPSANSISIDVIYDKDVYTNNGVQTDLQNPKVASVELMQQPLIKDNVNSLEGELLIQQKGFVNFELDNNGDLYISDEDANNYDVNTNGELIFNQTV